MSNKELNPNELLNLNDSDYIQAVRWRDNHLELLDQRLLPYQEIYVSCLSVDDVYQSIKNMTVRGAPAIGIAAAYGALISVTSHQNSATFKDNVSKDLDYLRQARPTAVNLMWAIDQMSDLLASQDDEPDYFAFERLAFRIHTEDIRNNELMGQFAANILKNEPVKPFNVMTHCNAGSLATGGFGTALGAIRAAFRNGLINRVYADETRPWMQGSRLTSWELKESGIPVTLNTEGAAASVISKESIKWVIVGADRIAANGDVANKIGTYNLAILAKYHDAKLMVVAPTSTVDLDTSNGRGIEIEYRDNIEITNFNDVNIAPIGVDVYNPVFDVTPASLVDVIVTEKGVVYSPTKAKISQLFLYDS